ncbi:MAG: cyclase family protein [Candidatus Omnitrophica bacterium]|nr:cyclase family protein [Candidatus Omnitrophota bacterium]
MRGKEWIDISLPVFNGMVGWPGDPVFKRTLFKDMGKGDTVYGSKLELSAHTGTHLDAPLHFLENGPSVDKLPIGSMVGPSRVVVIKDARAIKPEELAKHSIRKGERLLLKTVNSGIIGKIRHFRKDYVYLTLDGARYLAEKKVRLVGIDYYSIGGIDKAAKGRGTHKVLMSANIPIIEGLDLSGVKEGRYDLIVLPLRLAGSEASPVRAVVRRR